LAAEKVGRRCRAIEIDNPYCDLIIRRWEAATGREAVSEATGEIFARAAERRKSPGKPDKETPDNDELNAEIKARSRRRRQPGAHNHGQD